MRRFWIAGFLVVGLTTLAAAQAVPGLSISMMDAGDQTPTMWQPNGTGGSDDSARYTGQRNADHWSCSWDITAKADPWINAVVAVTNTTAVTQTYIFMATLPITPSLPGATFHGGSVQGGLTDNTVNAVLGKVTTDPVSMAPLYLGMIDGVGVLPLYPHSFSVSAPWDGGSASILAVSAGLPPPPTLPSGPALSSIGIKHTFTLTAGDTATLSSFFIVTPEPAGLLLLGLGGLALLGRRRGA